MGMRLSFRSKAVSLGRYPSHKEADSGLDSLLSLGLCCIVRIGDGLRMVALPITLSGHSQPGSCVSVYTV